MSAPMAGFGPMAWSPFPYGPVPSSGVISPFYVDLFNAQTVLGPKNWTVADAPGAAEDIAFFGVSGISQNISIRNRNASNGTFSGEILSVGSGTQLSFFLTAQVTSDAGTGPAMVLNSRLGTGSDMATRPLFSFRNNATEVASVSAKGAWTYTVLHTDAAAETLATWAMDEDTGSKAEFVNGTATNARFIPMLRLTQGSTFQNIVRGGGTTDTGTNPCLVLSGAIGTASNVVTRPVISFQNLITEMAQFTAAGSLLLANPITHASFTVATMPSAAIAGKEIYVSDAAVAPCLAFSNGTNWKRCDNAATTVV